MFGWFCTCSSNNGCFCQMKLDAISVKLAEMNKYDKEYLQGCTEVVHVCD